MPAKQERREAIVRRLQKQGRAGPRKKIEGGEYVKGLSEGGRPALLHRQERSEPKKLSRETEDAYQLRKHAIKKALSSRGTADTRALKISKAKKEWGMKP